MLLGFTGCGKTLSWVGFVSGHDFSRAEDRSEKEWALAPAVFVFCHLHSGCGSSRKAVLASIGTTKVVL
jgi:hypothetical protein